MSTHIHHVTQALRHRIGSGRYAPGTRLVELQVAAELGVSRTPVRLAFEELSREGLLERLPTRGFRVRVVHPQELADAIDVRGVLEGMSARLVAERGLSEEDRLTLQECTQTGRRLLAEAAANAEQLDAVAWTAMNAQFHGTLIRASGNRALASAMELITQMPLAGSAALSLHGTSPQLEYAFIERAQQDHEDLVKSVLAGEGARAEALMREHARRSRDNKRILMAAFLGQ